MAKTFKIGDHVSWNSEAGRVRGKIIKVHKRAAWALRATVQNYLKRCTFLPRPLSPPPGRSRSSKIEIYFKSLFNRLWLHVMPPLVPFSQSLRFMASFQTQTFCRPAGCSARHSRLGPCIAEFCTANINFNGSRYKRRHVNCTTLIYRGFWCPLTPSRRKSQKTRPKGGGLKDQATSRSSVSAGSPMIRRSSAATPSRTARFSFIRLE